MPSGEIRLEGQEHRHGGRGFVPSVVIWGHCTLRICSAKEPGTDSSWDVSRKCGG